MIYQMKPTKINLCNYEEKECHYLNVLIVSFLLLMMLIKYFNGQMTILSHLFEDFTIGDFFKALQKPSKDLSQSYHNIQIERERQRDR